MLLTLKAYRAFPAHQRGLSRLLAARLTGLGRVKEIWVRVISARRITHPIKIAHDCSIFSASVRK
jgi:hypothetical protein